MHRMSLALAAFVSAAAVAAAPQVRVLPKQTPIAVSVTLLPRDGKVGRDNPFSDNYRPQVRFSGAAAEVTCAVRLGSKDAQVAPGQTSAAQLVCLDDGRVLVEHPEFTLIEGGRKVGTGQVKP